VKLLINRSPEASRLLSFDLLERSFENFFEKNFLGDQKFSSYGSKRQSSLSTKFYDRKRTLQAEAISNIVWIDLPGRLASYQSIHVIYICDKT